VEEEGEDEDRQTKKRERASDESVRGWEGKREGRRGGRGGGMEE